MAGLSTTGFLFEEFRRWEKIHSIFTPVQSNGEVERFYALLNNAYDEQKDLFNYV